MDTPTIIGTLLQAHGVKDVISYPTECGIYSVNVQTIHGRTVTANIKTAKHLSDLTDIIEDFTSGALSDKKYYLKFEIN